MVILLHIQNIFHLNRSVQAYAVICRAAVAQCISGRRYNRPVPILPFARSSRISQPVLELCFICQLDRIIILKQCKIAVDLFIARQCADHIFQRFIYSFDIRCL